MTKTRKQRSVEQLEVDRKITNILANAKPGEDVAPRIAALKEPDFGILGTYWNGERTPCRKVRVIVGKPERPTWWCAGLEGTERESVEVNYYGEKFYLDNENGSGWRKVTLGRGSPQYGHASMPIERVIE